MKGRHAALVLSIALAVCLVPAPSLAIRYDTHVLIVLSSGISAACL